VWNESQYENITFSANKYGLSITEKDNKTKITLEGTEEQFVKFDKFIAA